MASLGAFGILRQSVKAFRAVRRPSVLFLLLLLALFYVWVVGFNIDWKIVDLMPFMRSRSRSVSDYVREYFDYPHDERFFVIGAFLLTYGLLFVVDLLFFFILSPYMVIAVSCTLGNICDGKSVAVSELLRAVGRLVWRMLATTLIYLVLVVLCCGVYFGLYCLLMVTLGNKLSGALILFAIFTILFIVSFAAIHVISSVARAVTCFEDYYGWAAFKRAKLLLRMRWRSGLLLLVILAVCSILLAILYKVAAAHVSTALDWTLGVIYMILAAALIQFELGCWAVFYLSRAAHCDNEVLESPAEGVPVKGESSV